MGKLIKNHWARLIVLTAAAYQIAATLEAFFWPKFFFDFLTKNFDRAVKPVPILQIINLVIGFLTLAYEWPLNYVAGTSIHRSLEVRLMWLPLASLTSILLYQATNASLYYFIGIIVYFWAYSEGEVICAVPWTLPKRADRRRIEKA
ncbi:hypothetical protein CLAFUW4_05051 [Fulvia fulva]|uniref:DUF7727 domain-containing protein n=1 Tax=Passalora fulva TaxID=5499 RepID=A0A9Q8PID4_PASFU|nr:uncharacterized protein CLAFUR5_11856 [Fulvia fulva]KAK4626906.1 hypothetical protein CLAFUR4_05037 [Fulvia fulva]KAK4628446.1 hypothetical protein CLAFUR0_05041 [Fulvia fulva]UJO23023.1 hypothetical protein CLAFUR5_11856 [Fulvia fulva]WPV13143.1 hypothetical protein CLAFUW4_05051 [Fulvia fulva]WPV29306.1 hypothetical protein CLAFUW7_05045 [Fulvia fulva]